MTIYLVVKLEAGKPDVPVKATDSMSMSTAYAITQENTKEALRGGIGYKVVPVAYESAGGTT